MSSKEIGNQRSLAKVYLDLTAKLWWDLGVFVENMVDKRYIDTVSIPPESMLSVCKK